MAAHFAEQEITPTQDNPLDAITKATGGLMSKSQLSHQLTNKKIEDIIEWIDRQPWGKEVSREIAKREYLKFADDMYVRQSIASDIEDLDFLDWLED